MGLLATLLAVAWSLLGTYRDAEQRGWNVSQRMQTIRLVRETLERDLLQVVVPEHQLKLQNPGVMPMDSNGRAATTFASTGVDGSELKASFRGNSNGFTTVIHSTVDPMPFLDRFLRGDDGDNLSVPRDAGPLSDLESQRRQQSWPLWLPDRMTVEYRLRPVVSRSTTSPALSQTEEESWILVRTEHSNLQQVQTPEESVFETTERTLSIADLYRSNDEASTPDQQTLRESTFHGLSLARFLYWDGSQWKSSWNSEAIGRLPSAISLSFDLKQEWKRTVPQRRASAEVDSESLFDLSEDVLSLHDDDLSLESNESMSSELEQTSPRDVRLVIRLGQASTAESRGAP